MSATLINGKAIAAGIKIRVKQAALQLAHRPGLATILVGTNPASALYVKNKLQACIETGIDGKLIHLPEDTTQEKLGDTITALNADPAIHGILLQLPLPPQLDAQKLIGLILPHKDVDGLGPLNYGLMVAGLPAHAPCTPLGCLTLIKSIEKNLTGKRALVLGRSRLVGRPMAELLLQHNCTVTLAHSHTQNLPDLTREADILVAAMGKPHLIKAGWIKPGATVIDVGINRLPNGSLTGDVDFEDVREIAGAITPVPGGVGPMTVAMLMANTLRSAYQHAQRPLPVELAA